MRKVRQSLSSSIDVFAAEEGADVQVSGCATEDADSPEDKRMITASTALVKPSLVLAVKDPSVAEKIMEAAKLDGIPVLHAASVEEAIELAKLSRPAVVVLEGYDLSPLEKALPDEDMRLDFPVVLVVEDERSAAQSGRGKHSDIELLIKPFSSAYVRTFIRASLLRTANHVGERQLRAARSG
jgi:DNA-binding response OmpR family regulator